MAHSHDIGLSTWPFADAENTACFSCRHVLDDGQPVLRVAHDDDDGAWQFLCGESHELEDAKLVCLGCMIVGDRSLAELSDLPLGWCAERVQVSATWTREPNIIEDEDSGDDVDS